MANPFVQQSNSNPFTSFLSGNSNMLLGLGAGLLSGNLGNAPLYAMQGSQQDDAYATKAKEDAARQAQITSAAEAARQAGNEQLAQLIESGMGASEAATLYKTMNPTAPGGDERFFGNIVPMQDENGNVVLGQASTAGRWQPLQGAEGMTPAPTTKTQDIGTHIITTDIYGNELYRTPKENYQEAYDTSAGGAQGKVDVERAAHAPQAVANAETMLSQIDGVLNDPNLGWAVGLGGMVPAIPNTPQAGVVAKIEQLQGQAFLQAFETLKGGGQITEIEGAKATNAIARLQRSQSKEDFMAALIDLKEIVTIGLQRAQRQLPSGPGAQPGAPNSSVDDILGGYGL